MTDTTYTPAYAPRVSGFFARAESWLDERGNGAWIASFVLGFIFFWPVGLALLFYWLFFRKNSGRSMRCAARNAMRRTSPSTGNRAFDAYRDETLRRLEDEQKSFEKFLERLREAKDKAEFDQFMDDRAAKRSERDDRDDDDLRDATPA